MSVKSRIKFAFTTPHTKWNEGIKRITKHHSQNTEGLICCFCQCRLVLSPGRAATCAPFLPGHRAPAFNLTHSLCKALFTTNERAQEKHLDYIKASTGIIKKNKTIETDTYTIKTFYFIWFMHTGKKQQQQHHHIQTEVNLTWSTSNSLSGGDEFLMQSLSEEVLPFSLLSSFSLTYKYSVCLEQRDRKGKLTKMADTRQQRTTLGGSAHHRLGQFFQPCDK